ncbi:MAG TPA: transglutaminase-like domain-containing protein [Pirellulales bacterium]|jgi:transglutaminase-like putative cysteine protease|nr:transglutaminase-like domain-containing protein [Pirellulales bacterium]
MQTVRAQDQAGQPRLARRRGGLPWLVVLVSLSLVAQPQRAAGDSSANDPPADDSQYALLLGKPREVEAVLTMDLRAPQVSATEWWLFAARPPALACQTHPSVRLLPGGEEYVEDAPLARPLLRARLLPGQQATKHGFSARLEYKAQLASRRLVRREPGQKYHVPERLSAAQREQYVSANELYDFKMPAFQQWLRENRLLRSPSEGDTDFARRVFLVLKPKLRYEYHETMDRSATSVARTRVSDCGGMSLLLASVLRAGGVPARVIAGRWAVSSKPGAMVGDVKYAQQHVKAEFYARGVGWVPVDMSSAVLHDPAPEGLRYFGSDRGNFFVIHVDPLLHVSDGHGFKQTYTWLQGFHYHYHGKGSLADSTDEKSWRVTWSDSAAAGKHGGLSP